MDYTPQYQVRLMDAFLIHLTLERFLPHGIHWDLASQWQTQEVERIHQHQTRYVDVSSPNLTIPLPTVFLGTIW